MARKPLGKFQMGEGLLATGKDLACVACGTADAFEARSAYIWGMGWGWTNPWRKVKQVRCWNCGHLHLFAR